MRRSLDEIKALMEEPGFSVTDDLTVEEQLLVIIVSMKEMDRDIQKIHLAGLAMSTAAIMESQIVASLKKRVDELEQKLAKLDTAAYN